MGSDELDALRQEVENLRSVVFHSTEFIKSWTPDGTRSYVNDAYCRYFGVEPQEIVGTSFFSDLSPESRATLAQTIQQLTPEHPVIIGEHAIERDGSTVWIEWTDRAIFDDHGELVEIQSIGRDVTDRRKAMDALRDSEEKYRKLVEEAMDAILVSSEGGRILHLNPAAIHLLGFESREEAIGTDLRTLYADRQRYDEALKRLIEKGSLKDLELTLIGRDESEHTVLQSATMIRDSEGSIAAIRMILHDISRRRQLEQQLYHAQRLEAVGKLAAGIAHDFNNLLTVIGGNAELLATDFAQGSPHRVSIESIREASEKAVSLTQQLLAYGRKQILRPEQVSVNRVVEETAAMLRRTVGEDIEILTSLASNAGIVEVDPQQLKQVLVNLAVNSRDAMPHGGQLDISTAKADSISHAGQEIESGSFIRLTVTDTGSGIPEEHLSRIFEPFFTTKQMQRGTGLGLATVYGIIRQSHGRIFASNRADGEGSVFDIYLPRVESTLSESQSNDSSSSDLTTEETLLLVEDDAAVLETMRKTLERRGYRVLEASSAVEALAIYRQRASEISLVLADVVMPRMNGYQMVDAMVASAPPKVLFISGYSDETLARQDSALPQAYPLLRKPFSPALLVTRVREVLDQVGVVH